MRRGGGLQPRQHFRCLHCELPRGCAVRFYRAPARTSALLLREVLTPGTHQNARPMSLTTPAHSCPRSSMSVPVRTALCLSRTTRLLILWRPTRPWMSSAIRKPDPDWEPRRRIGLIDGSPETDAASLTFRRRGPSSDPEAGREEEALCRLGNRHH